MRLFFFILLPLCLIGAAFLVPVNRSTGVSDVITGIQNLSKNDSADALCQSIEQRNRVLKIQIKTAEIRQALPVQKIEVVHPMGERQNFYIQKDSIK